MPLIPAGPIHAQPVPVGLEGDEAAPEIEIGRRLRGGDAALRPLVVNGVDIGRPDRFVI